ncbi:MAG: type II secretion system protein [bacterium]
MSVMRPKGFTLIELLIVVAIIGILAAVAVPHFVNARIKAAQSALRADMRILSVALDSYQLDNGAILPGSSRLHMSRVVDSQFLSELTTPVSYLTSEDSHRRTIDAPIFYGGPPDGGSNVLTIYRGLLHSAGDVRFRISDDGLGFQSIPEVWQIAAGNPGYTPASLPALAIMTYPGGLELLNRMRNGYLPLTEYPGPLHLPVNPFYNPSNGIQSMGDFYMNCFQFHSF